MKTNRQECTKRALLHEALTDLGVQNAAYYAAGYPFDHREIDNTTISQIAVDIFKLLSIRSNSLDDEDFRRKIEALYLPENGDTNPFDREVIEITPNAASGTQKTCNIM